jgi:hypothetical protein
VSGERLINIFLVFLSSGPLTRDHPIELEVEELAKRYHGEKKGNVNSNKGRKKPTKKRLGQLWKSLHRFIIDYHP